MESSRSETLMTTLGFRPETGRLYDRMLPLAGRPVDEVASSLATSVERLRRDLEPLAEFDIVSLADGTLTVLNQTEVVARMLAITAERASVAHDRLLNISKAMPYVAGTVARAAAAQPADEQPLDGELFSSRYMPETLEALVGGSTGDLLWLRPDQWAMPWEDHMTAMVAEAIANGRRCRAIYPVRAMAEAPVAMAARARAGEEIRLLADVPTRLLVIGSTHAIIPEPLGNTSSPRIMVRQRGIVEALTLLFERLWEAGTPVADFERARHGAAQRSFLLEQLASGAQDEQIARRLGISLRTVRRRVAELMTELGATSRFQAGAEAARRGWL